MVFPRPGRAVRGSRTGRPIMALLDLLGRRMSLRILWELSQADAPRTFRALQAAAETNPGVLNTRLKELRAATIVVGEVEGYVLSEQGRALVQHLLPLHVWAEEWGAAILAPRRRGKNAPRRTTHMSPKRGSTGPR
jgi:DNA-binding HxlR family transcriptional regulator